MADPVQAEKLIPQLVSNLQSLGYNGELECLVPAVKDGENHAAQVYRAKFNLSSNGSLKTKKTYIIKIEMTGEKGKRHKEYGINEIEHKIYKEILPHMERLITKLGSAEDTLWAHCIGHFDNTTLVLEDLKELGYKTGDRQRGLDYPHASVAVRSLARFHALSVSLRENKLLNPSDFSKFIFAGGFDSVNDFITSTFYCLHSVASLEWSPAWRDIIDNIRRIPDIAVDKLREITRLENSKFHVLNHGDPWVNNMMFRYKKDDIPDSLRFVDFQLSHYNSCAFDLHYLMNTSVSSEVLHHIDRLYEEYHEQLVTEFSHLGIAGCPTLPELLEELQRTEFFGLFSAVCIAPVIMASQDIAPLKDQTGYSLAELEKRKKDRFRTYEYTKRIQVILRRAQLGGLFKKLFI